MAWVNADIDFRDLDEDDLIDELVSRGYKIETDTPTDLDRELVIAFKLKKFDKVLELIRKDLEDRKGIVL